MINTTSANKKDFPKRAKHRANMQRINESARPFIINVWDAREKRITHSLNFITKYEAQDYLDKKTIKRGLRHYHKGAFGVLDMELEYTLKNS